MDTKLKPKQGVMIIIIVLLLLASTYPGLPVTGGGKVYAAGEFAGGSGTILEPYQIASAEQLNEMRLYPDQHFILSNDIDMSAYNVEHPWVPIGDRTDPFTGSLDGQNHKIYNLFIHAPASTEPVGLFGVVSGTTGYIKNVRIEAVEVSGDNNVGILAGESSTEIRNVGVTGNVYGSNYVGGIVGISTGDGYISNSYAAANVTGIDNVGGLSGHIHNGYITYSYATGDVTGHTEVGGFVGKQLNAEITYSYATGNVVGCEDTGGFVGDSEDLISNSFATGAVTGYCEGGGSDSIGGLVGDGSDGRIEHSFSIGRVTGDSLTGGLVGIGRSWEIMDSYYDLDTSGQEDLYGEGKGLTSEEMKDPRNFTGWDFENIWDIHALHHYGYPYLRDIQAFVTYESNGTDHSGNPYSSHSYQPGSMVEIQDINAGWTKAGYRFNGWNTAIDGSGDTYDANDTIALSGNILLYADWEPLAAPTITEPTDDLYTNDSRLEIRGKAESGATAVIILNGHAKAAVTAAAIDGSWSWTPTDELADGLYTVSAGIADVMGNLVNKSAERTFKVDTVAPVITLLGDATMTLIEGTAYVEPGVNVTGMEGEYPSIPIELTGSVDHEVPGIYTLQYVVRDRAGNVAVPVTRTVQVIERDTGGGGHQPQPSDSVSDNANLAKLTVKAGGEELVLTPEFKTGTTSYRAGTTADVVIIEAIPDDRKAAVTLNKGAFHEKKAVTLAEGDNDFEMIVKAENGMLRTYNLTIHRWTESVGPEPDPDPELPVCAFGDIEGHWAALSICEAFNIGIVKGHSETIFQPEMYITRVEFAAMLLRTLGIHSGLDGKRLTFTDQDQIPAWATDVVSTAVQSGILQGYPDRTLRPTDRVSRSEMVVMMANALKWDFEQGDTSFADNAEIPAWAKGYVNGAAQRNLVVGREGNRFSPADPATRAEATTLLLRLWHIHSAK